MSCTPFTVLCSRFSKNPRPEDHIFADAQAALQRITSDAPGPGQHYALAIAQQAHGLWEQRRVSVQFRWVPSHAGTAGNEKADE